MIITYINNNKLFIQFDKLVKKGLIFLNDDKKFKKYQDINNSEFEIIELPDEQPCKINIQIDIGDIRIFKSIKVKKIRNNLKKKDYEN